MAKCALVLLACYTAIPCFAQRQTCIGFESAYNLDKWLKVDFPPYGLVVKHLNANFSGGVVATRELSESLRFETGLFFKNYRVGFRVDNEDYELFQKQPEYKRLKFNTINVPLRIVGRLPANPGKSYITFTSGLIYTHHNGASGFHSDTTLYGDSLSYFYSAVMERQTYLLFQAGVGLDAALAENLWLSVTFGYTGGFKELGTMSVSYELSPGNFNTGKIISTGGYFGTSIGVRYNLNQQKGQKK